MQPDGGNFSFRLIKTRRPKVEIGHLDGDSLSISIGSLPILLKGPMVVNDSTKERNKTGFFGPDVTRDLLLNMSHWIAPHVDLIFKGSCAT